MELTVLAVPDCPTGQLLRERLAVVLADHPDTSLTWHETTDEREAVRRGMRGSPTLLVNGRDPFVRAGERASVSCRLYGPEEDAVAGAPSVARLRTVLAEAAAAELLGRGSPVGGRLAPKAGGLRAVQQAVLRSFATHGRPPTPAELDAAAAPSGVPAEQVLRDLSAADYLSLDADGTLRAAYPFSPTPTAYRVVIAEGPQVWAMCAIDALGISPMLGRDVTIHSADPVTGDPVTVTFTGSTVTWDPATAVVVVPTGACHGPAVDACCEAVNFHADAASAARRRAAHPHSPATVLDQNRAEAVGRTVFGPLLT
ncbi:organomercurial lyase [Streptomyces sp. E11-3]|uniref:organomercurial lyase n=1 Tax=Streptomyces sp. E11-3 TaxID=3110112 RepID=UPI0039815FFD